MVSPGGVEVGVEVGIGVEVEVGVGIGVEVGVALEVAVALGGVDPCVLSHPNNPATTAILQRAFTLPARYTAGFAPTIFLLVSARRSSR
jgi:hypothetical protein